MTRIVEMPRIVFVAATLLLFLLLLVVHGASAASSASSSSSGGGIPCTTDADCHAAYQTTSTSCLSASETCSNPFQQGCLRMLDLQAQYLANNIAEQQLQQQQNEDGVSEASLPVFPEQSTSTGTTTSTSTTTGTTQSLTPPRVCNSDDMRTFKKQGDDRWIQQPIPSLPFSATAATTPADNNNNSNNSNNNSHNSMRQCVLSEFDNIYPEIRVHSGNWESSLLLAWIYQIVLSEFLQVPTTVGLTSLDTPTSSFYSERMDDDEAGGDISGVWPFSPEAYPYEALQQANQVAGFDPTSSSDSNYFQEDEDSWDDKQDDANGNVPGMYGGTMVNHPKRLDCSSTVLPCVDVLPEVWMGQSVEYLPLIRDKVIEPTTGNGLLGHSGLYIPARTAREFPQFSIWYGLAGEANRRLLAETFLRPLTWLEYCQQVSETSCDGGGGGAAMNASSSSSSSSSSSATATRLPTEDEQDLYYYYSNDPKDEGLVYAGYFAATDANNCTLNPTTCTGHIVTPPCSWSAPLDAQLYWNDIVGLARDGPLAPVGGYTAAQMMQIYRAANATNNHVILHWYEPEPLHFEFQPQAGGGGGAGASSSSDYEFVPITLPTPSGECLAAWPDVNAKCSDDLDLRRGNTSLARCGATVESLQRLTAKSLADFTESLPDVDQSPAHQFLKHIQLSNNDIGNIIRQWRRRRQQQQQQEGTRGKTRELSQDQRRGQRRQLQEEQPQQSSMTPSSSSGYDIRMAVCEWVADNQETLQAFFPPGYPRDLVERSDYDAWYVIVTRVLGGAVAAMAFVAFLAVLKFRNTKTMIFAQPLFVCVILVGFCMVSIGAVLYTMDPKQTHCVAAVWMLSLGYTIELVPVLVKTAKINQLVRSYSKTQRRIQLNRWHMLCQVAGVVLLAVAFLMTWTILDPPTKLESRSLMATRTLQDGHVESFTTLESDTRCASQSSVWRLVAYGWQAILLVLAAFLAFQSRGVMQQLNESKSLAVMVYSHFLFVVLRGVCSIFYVQNIFPSSITASIMSLIYSLDAFTAMSIYVVPKLWASRKAPDSYKPGMLSSTAVVGARSSIDGGGGGLDNDDENDDDDDDDHEFHRNGVVLDNKDNLERPSPLVPHHHRDPKALSILVCSANMGNKEPTIESLEAWIPSGGCSQEIKALPNDDETTGEEPQPQFLLNRFETFDLIAIGMQEATWTTTTTMTTSMKESLLTSNGINNTSANGQPQPQQKKEITEEEVMFALEEANTAQLREMVREVLGDDYYQIADERRGQMRLHIWARRKVAQAVTEVKINGANTGIGNVLANKGGIVGTVYLQKTRISFVTAHLAAHEGDSYYKMRCENIRSILKEAKTLDVSSPKLDVVTSSHYTFFLGDLNFRTRFEDKSLSHDEKLELSRDLIESESYSKLYELDELRQGLKKEDLLVGFETLPCPFPPTFKVERDGGFQYKGQRIPSYTDRILFHAAPGLREHLKTLSYEACRDFITSDHKPIRGAFCLTSNASLDTTQVDQDMVFDFAKIRCANLQAANTNGKSDPYVMIVWDGVLFHSEHVAPWDFLRSFWSGTATWPRTSRMSKTVNPHWKGEEIGLSLKNTKVTSEGMLFLAVVHYDKMRGRHELLGSAALNVRDLIATMMNCSPTLDAASGGQIEIRTLNFEERLVRDGMDSGRIKFTLNVKRKRVEPGQAGGGAGGRGGRRSSMFIGRGLHRNWKSTRFGGSQGNNQIDEEAESSPDGLATNLPPGVPREGV